MVCDAAEASGLGFVCFVVIVRCQPTELILGFFLFHKYSNFTPPPPLVVPGALEHVLPILPIKHVIAIAELLAEKCGVDGNYCSILVTLSLYPYYTYFMIIVYEEDLHMLRSGWSED